MRMRMHIRMQEREGYKLTLVDESSRRVKREQQLKISLIILCYPLPSTSLANIEYLPACILNVPNSLAGRVQYYWKEGYVFGLRHVIRGA